MNKKLKLSRGTIWICDFNSIYKDKVKNLQKGLRPVLIISNNRNNTHNNAVQVVPITSENKKNMPTHINIKSNFGLMLDSTILVEGLTAVDKFYLKEYVGMIDDKTMKEVEEAIRIQAGFVEIFNKKYLFDLLDNIINLKDNAEELRIILSDNFNEYTKKYRAEIEELIFNNRNIVKNAYDSNEYLKCINICKNIYNLLLYMKNDSNNNYEYNKWFFIFRIALSYFKLKDYTKSIDFYKEAIIYTSQSYDDTKYLECIGMLGLCYKNLRNRNKALEYYNICIDYYKKLEMVENLSIMLYNKGVLLENCELIKEAINIRLKHNFTSNKNALNICYEALVEFNAKNNIDEAKYYLELIDDNNLKDKLLKQFF